MTSPAADYPDSTMDEFFNFKDASADKNAVKYTGHGLSQEQYEVAYRNSQPGWPNEPEEVHPRSDFPAGSAAGPDDQGFIAAQLPYYHPAHTNGLHKQEHDIHDHRREISADLDPLQDHTIHSYRLQAPQARQTRDADMMQYQPHSSNLQLLEPQDTLQDTRSTAPSSSCPSGSYALVLPGHDGALGQPPFSISAAGSDLGSSRFAGPGDMDFAQAITDGHSIPEDWNPCEDPVGGHAEEQNLEQSLYPWPLDQPFSVHGNTGPYTVGQDRPNLSPQVVDSMVEIANSASNGVRARDDDGEQTEPIAKDYQRLAPRIHDHKRDCLTCGKHFKYPKDLRRHIIIHLNEWPHVCARCSRGFKREDHMKRHSQICGDSATVASGDTAPSRKRPRTASYAGSYVGSNASSPLVAVSTGSPSVVSSSSAMRKIASKRKPRASGNTLSPPSKDVRLGYRNSVASSPTSHWSDQEVFSPLRQPQDFFGTPMTETTTFMSPGVDFPLFSPGPSHSHFGAPDSPTPAQRLQKPDA